MEEDQELEPRPLDRQVILNTIFVAGELWVWNKEDTPEPHYLVLQTYRRHFHRYAEENLISIFTRRLGDILPDRSVSVETRIRQAPDHMFASATFLYAAPSSMPNFSGDHFSVLDLAIILGFNKLANLLLDYHVPLITYPNDERAVHPLTALLFALRWNIEYDTDDVRDVPDPENDVIAVANRLAIRLIDLTPDDQFERLPAPIQIWTEPNRTVLVKYPFVAGLMILDCTRLVVENYLIRATFARPCRPADPAMISVKGDESGRSVIFEWTTILSIFECMDTLTAVSCIEHPDVGRFLADLLYTKFRESETTGVPFEAHDEKAYTHICKRVRDDPRIRQAVLRSAVRFEPRISAEIDNLCGPIETTDAAWRNPVAARIGPEIPLAPARRLSGSESVVFPPRRPQATEVVQAQAVPLIQDFYPYSDEEERIPSRFGGSSSRTRMNRRTQTKRTKKGRRPSNRGAKHPHSRGRGRRQTQRDAR